ncbi:MAG: glycosyltransferase family 2 protein [Deltaproteobacteria bacterium]|nr:glycosyltransferase family 2 protein [Deltaproteobacteria bacterium]
MTCEPSPGSLSAALIIPALNEAESIGGVVAGFVAAERRPGVRWLDEVIVVDNGSTDATSRVAEDAGATIVTERQRGYGAACLAGLAYLRDRAPGPPTIVVFADGDGANVPDDLGTLLAPIERGAASMVIGARDRRAEPGSLTLPQRFGNVLAARLMRHLYGAQYSDLGPFRAIRWDALTALGMKDLNYGWTVEMQLKAVKLGVPATEVDVRNRCRVGGQSKVAGTVRGVVGAGVKILWTIFRYRST